MSSQGYSRYWFQLMEWGSVRVQMWIQRREYWIERYWMKGRRRCIDESSHHGGKG